MQIKNLHILLSFIAYAMMVMASPIPNANEVSDIAEASADEVTAPENVLDKTEAELSAEENNVPELPVLENNEDSNEEEVPDTTEGADNVEEDDSEEETSLIEDGEEENPTNELGDEDDADDDEEDNTEAAEPSDVADEQSSSEDVPAKKLEDTEDSSAEDENKTIPEKIVDGVEEVIDTIKDALGLGSEDEDAPANEETPAKEENPAEEEEDVNEAPVEGQNSENEEGDVKIVIKGTKKDCEEAKKQIKRIVDESSIVLTREVEAPRDVHRALNTRFRSHMDAIATKYSVGNDKVRFNFPYGFEEGEELNKVFVRAPREHIDECVEAFKKLVEKAIEDVNNRVSIEISVPRTDLARIVGTKGSNINEISRKYEVSIDMHRDFSDSDMVPITISGLDMEKIEGAKKEILEKASTLVTIPLTELQYLYVMNNQQFSKNRRQNGVFVNYAPGKISINGDKKSAEAYKENTEKKLKEIANYKEFKQLTLDSSVCSLIIGRGGSNINRLEKETKCRILVNSSRDGEEKENNVLILAKNSEELSVGVKAIQDIKNRHQNEVTMKLDVPNHLHGRLIGAKGKNLESIKKASGKSVRINFPPRNHSKSNTIEIVGDQKEVKKCIELIEKNVEELKREFGDDEEESASEVSSTNIEENKSNNGQRHIPGYSEKKINILKSSDVLVDELANAMNYLGIRNYQQKETEESEWKVIGKKKNTTANDEDDAEADSEISAAKKKKNKKKNKKKKAAEQKAREEAEAAAAAEAERLAREEAERKAKEEEEAALAAAAAEAEAALAAGSEEQKKKKKKNKKKKNAAAKAEAEAEVESSSVEEREVAPAPVVEEKPVEDEWISIPTKKQTNKSKKNNDNTTQVSAASVNAFANLNDDGAEKKKKKKNKKKKNNNADN